MSCEIFSSVNFHARRGARLIIPNNDKEYSRLGRTMANARRAGMVDWDYLEDRTRELETFSSWESPADILHSAAQRYRENLWQRQHFQPEDWMEKSALVGVIKPACERWRVPHMAARGYPSHSELYAAGKRLDAHIGNGAQPIVLYLGDHDPSGLDMTRSLREELSLYARRSVEVVRFGLNLDQVRELTLPPNPAKESDARFEQYVRATGCTDSCIYALSLQLINDFAQMPDRARQAVNFRETKVSPSRAVCCRRTRKGVQFELTNRVDKLRER
jgi:hypothetical protein